MASTPRHRPWLLLQWATAIMLATSAALLTIATSSAARDWAQRVVPILYSGSVCGDYRALYFLVGIVPAVAVSGTAVLAWRSSPAEIIPRATLATLGCVGLMVALAWSAAWIVIGLGTCAS